MTPRRFRGSPLSPTTLTQIARKMAGFGNLEHWLDEMERTGRDPLFPHPVDPNANGNNDDNNEDDDEKDDDKENNNSNDEENEMPALESASPEKKPDDKTGASTDKETGKATGKGVAKEAGQAQATTTPAKATKAATVAPAAKETKATGKISYYDVMPIDCISLLSKLPDPGQLGFVHNTKCLFPCFILFFFLLYAFFPSKHQYDSLSDRR